ncbi:hypothetical protein AVEN_70174-1 [Araneus ventricosus]|uniref:Uncharacterized protein n=1 Tax=Araneus ventricosus TaxID=182803 RepID=A0A4Y2FDD7_ARAVE|nr:hypothetical protein AVEN_70174-1 [Araneus ventricosus]
MDSKIFVPLLPSLLHLAVVKESMNLYNDFHTETLDEAYRRIQQGNSMASEDSENYPGCNSAQKKLIRIPPLLRKRVREAIHGLKSGVELWRKEHSSILELDDGECIFYWRCDGTIDTVKTAEHLVLNSNIDIRKRFYIACMYCLEKSIQTLWAEIEATGKTEDLETTDYCAARFWVRWLLDESRLPWKQATRQYLSISYPAIRFSSFLPSLRPEERFSFLCTFNFATYDDLRFCLYSLTAKEEKEILRLCSITVLRSYLQWPLRSLFLETAEKMWKYIDERKYVILDDLLSSRINRKVFDFYDLLECFWNTSPNSFREGAKEIPHLSEKVESCFHEMNRKRKAHSDEEIQKIKN